MIERNILTQPLLANIFARQHNTTETIISEGDIALNFINPSYLFTTLHGAFTKASGNFAVPYAKGIRYLLPPLGMTNTILTLITSLITANELQSGRTSVQSIRTP